MRLKSLFLMSTLMLALPTHGAEVATSVSGVHRLRYEHLSDGPRPNAQRTDQILVSRLFLSAKVEGEQWFGELEIQDSRSWLHDSGTPLGTDDVNTLEPIQAWLGWRGGEALPLQVRVGRITKNLSTRRLMARNRYRNTTNGFTGADLTWRSRDWSLYAFLFRPVLREPSDRAALANNDFELDDTSSGQRFWGAEFTRNPDATQASNTTLDWSVHILGLQENDRPAFPSRNRELITLGSQYHQFNADTGWHHAGEVALQVGTSRQTALESDTRDLHHLAGFLHAEVGHRWNDPWQNRLTLLADYASGDRDLTDNHNQRFDNLFGARRFDFGPTGIYGPQGRSNMISPGLRWDATPFAPTRLMLTWRGFWLAQTFDRHEGTDFLDTLAGARHVGQQVELRVRQRLSSRFELEGGAAYLDKGALLQSPLLNNAKNNALYYYLQTTLRF